MFFNASEPYNLFQRLFRHGHPASDLRGKLLLKLGSCDEFTSFSLAFGLRSCICKQNRGPGAARAACDAPRRVFRWRHIEGQPCTAPKKAAGRLSQQQNVPNDLRPETKSLLSKPRPEPQMSQPVSVRLLIVPSTTGGHVGEVLGQLGHFIASPIAAEKAIQEAVLLRHSHQELAELPPLLVLQRPLIIHGPGRYAFNQIHSKRRRRAQK